MWNIWSVMMDFSDVVVVVDENFRITCVYCFFISWVVI